jgi:hypothetical protein
VSPEPHSSAPALPNPQYGAQGRARGELAAAPARNGASLARKRRHTQHAHRAARCGWQDEWELPLKPYPLKTAWNAAASTFQPVDASRGGVERVARALPPGCGGVKSDRDFTRAWVIHHRDTKARRIGRFWAFVPSYSRAFADFYLLFYFRRPSSLRNWSESSITVCRPAGKIRQLSRR